MTQGQIYAKFRQLFPVGKRPKKLNMISTVTVASGDQLECLGVYPIPFEIDEKKFEGCARVYRRNWKSRILHFFNDRLNLRFLANDAQPGVPEVHRLHDPQGRSV